MLSRLCANVYAAVFWNRFEQVNDPSSELDAAFDFVGFDAIFCRLHAKVYVCIR